LVRYRPVRRSGKQLLFTLMVMVPGIALAQGYGSERPWGRLPYSPGAQQQGETTKRYNPWAEMRESDRLPPPSYRGEADEHAPKYHEPDPTYRELPEHHGSLSDPRAYASPWSEQYRLPGYGSGYPPYTPYYPAAVMPWANWGYSYGAPAIRSPYAVIPPWGGAGGAWPW
jgi:hypothetical protein